MEERKNAGGPAFPVECDTHDFFTGEVNGRSVEPGMTIRDWFAGQAIAGMIATSATPSITGLCGAENVLATAAYKIADAMLAERDK